MSPTSGCFTRPQLSTLFSSRLLVLAIALIWTPPAGAFPTVSDQAQAGSQTETPEASKPAEAEPTSPAQAGSSKAPAKKGAVDPNQVAMRRIWWNQQKKITALKLTNEQRLKMDALLQDFLGQRKQYSQAQRKALNELGRLALNGPTAELEAQADVAAASTTASHRHQIRMMVQVAQLLTPEQKSVIQESFPRLFSKLWIKPYPARPAGQARKVRKRSRAGGQN